MRLHSIYNPLLLLITSSDEGPVGNLKEGESGSLAAQDGDRRAGVPQQGRPVPGGPPPQRGGERAAGRQREGRPHGAGAEGVPGGEHPVAEVQGAHKRDDRHKEWQVSSGLDRRRARVKRPALQSSCLSVVSLKAHVPGSESERVRTGPERHVFFLAGLCVGRQPQVEVRERGVGPRRQTGAPDSQLRLHPSRLSKLRRALDESSGLLQ